MSQPQKPAEPPAKANDQSTGVVDGMEEAEPKGTPDSDRHQTETVN